MTPNEAAAQLRSELSNYYGSESLYGYQMNRRVKYTEGAQHFFQTAGGGAYWLLDILGTEPAILKEAREFAVVTLTVQQDTSAILSVTDGGKDGDEPREVYRRSLSFTTCPPGEWEFFFENNTIMLPSER